MLPIIKNRLLPSIGTMHDIALRYIFDRPSVSAVECRMLEEGLAGWSHKVDLDRSERWELKRITNALIANEKGYFERSKLLQRQHNVTYRQIYSKGLPYIDVENRKHFNKN